MNKSLKRTMKRLSKKFKKLKKESENLKKESENLKNEMKKFVEALNAMTKQENYDTLKSIIQNATIRNNDE